MTQNTLKRVGGLQFGPWPWEAAAPAKFRRVGRAPGRGSGRKSPWAHLGPGGDRCWGREHAGVGARQGPTAAVKVKMSTRGGWIVEPENHKLFRSCQMQVRRLRIFFRILWEIRRIRENVRIIRPARERLNRQKLNLLKSKSVKIGYALGWDKPAYPLKTCRNLNTK
jgi:hypothetical protein